MRIFPPSVFVCLLFVAGTAGADVLRVFSERQGMSGQFAQRIVTPEGELLETSEGQFSLLRPHFMRWQIESPDQQLFIVNENTLTQIDWDLEVVSFRPMTLDNRSALDWLMAPAEELEQTFDIISSSRQAILIPREQTSAFERLEIEFEEASLRWELSLTDSAGQILTVTLTEDPDVRPTRSDFDTPPTDFK
ncbi:outer membrane lipoprotein carrier protein LolA [Luminiphilus sp.]|nr:outer membrane lipoprotein carrier protein LolA [Luminiphilus sp.]